MTEQPIDPASKDWRIGERYILRFRVTNFGTTGQRQHAIDNAMRALAEKPNVKVLSYRWNDDRLSVKVQAIGPASPVVWIVGGVIAVCALYLISVTFESAALLVESAGESLESAGPAIRWGIGLTLIAGAVLAVLAGYKAVS